MAINPASDYGEDIACLTDADDLFTTAVGIDIIAQDALHYITQESFLGPGGDGRGIDVRKFVGMDADALAAQQPTVVSVLTDDDRIDSAEVVLVQTTTNGLADVEITVTCETALGSFTFTKPVSSLVDTFGDPES